MGEGAAAWARQAPAARTRRRAVDQSRHTWTVASAGNPQLLLAAGDQAFQLQQPGSLGAHDGCGLAWQVAVSSAGRQTVSTSRAIASSTSWHRSSLAGARA